MRLRVLDDDYPGYAQLAFDGRQPVLKRPTLSLSVRSSRTKSYLGPDGLWQSAPTYFIANRIEGEEGRALFRIGPEIVNHLLHDDIVEFATADDALQVETVWENAVAQISAGRGDRSIYREPATVGGRSPALVRRAESKPAAPVEDPPAEGAAAVEEPTVVEAAKINTETIARPLPPPPPPPLADPAPPPVLPVIVSDTPSAPPPIVAKALEPPAESPPTDVARVQEAPPVAEQFDRREAFGKSALAKYLFVAFLVFGIAGLAYGMLDAANFSQVEFIFVALFFAPGIITLGMAFVVRRGHRAATWVLAACAALCLVGIVFDAAMLIWFMSLSMRASHAHDYWMTFVLLIYGATLAAHGPGLVYFYRMSAPKNWPGALRGSVGVSRSIEAAEPLPPSLPIGPPAVAAPPQSEMIDRRAEYGRGALARYVSAALIIFGVVGSLYGVIDMAVIAQEAHLFARRPEEGLVVMTLLIAPGLITFGMGLVAGGRHRVAAWLLLSCAVLCIVGLIFDVLVAAVYLMNIVHACRHADCWTAPIFLVFGATLIAHVPAFVYFYRMGAPAGWPGALRQIQRSVVVPQNQPV